MARYGQGESICMIAQDSGHAVVGTLPEGKRSVGAANVSGHESATVLQRSISRAAHAAIVSTAVPC